MKVFGIEISLGNAVAIAAAVASLFNLNSHQEAMVNNYVKMQTNSWILSRKSEKEIEDSISGYVMEIKD